MRNHRGFPIHAECRTEDRLPEKATSLAPPRCFPIKTIPPPPPIAYEAIIST